MSCTFYVNYTFNKMDFLTRLFLTMIFYFVDLPGHISSETKCPRKFHGITGHTACIPTNPNVLQSGITDADKRLIVDIHNKYRTMVQPPACVMFKLSWDEELSMLAKKWAENCEFTHEPNYQRRIPGKYNVGQNLAYGYQSWESVMKAWYDEYKDYNYGEIKHNGVVGHYTQMVWDRTTRIGCYFANCKNLRNYYVCNYAVGGNFAGKQPYESCARGGRLNDCQGKTCYNGGTLDPDTCQCKCTKFNFIYGPQCSMNCSGTHDASFCNMRKSLCSVYSNVPDSCPWLCNICPYAGYDSAAGTHSPTRFAFFCIALISLWNFLVGCI